MVLNALTKFVAAERSDEAPLDIPAVLTRVGRRLPRYVRLIARLVNDRRISAWQKAPLALAAGYAVSPIDLVPGVIPLLGQLDDLQVVLLAVQATINRLPPDLANEHLTAVGLTEEQVEGDYRDVSAITMYLVRRGARGAAAAAKTGSRAAKRAAEEGLRSFRTWQAGRTSAKTPDADSNS